MDMRGKLFYCFLISGSVWTSQTFACDWQTGEREQKVFLSWDGQRLDHWTVEPGEIKAVELPNGFQLGLKLENPEPEKIIDYREKIPHPPEMVSISLYDLAGDAPVFLTRTYGGTNSIQGYGARGGADRVDVLGDPGISLTLFKPVCLPPDSAE
ncbi:hypothetical protein [Marinicella sediminis]|nr:hypothetical protein [Marinicella sediminis]